MRYRFDSFVLDVDQGRLNGPDGEIALRRQTLRALEVLLERAPALVSRDELLDTVWGRQAISANTVSQTILELRRALGDSPAEGRLIETRHRIGYRIVPPVECEAPAGDTGPGTHDALPTDAPGSAGSSTAVQGSSWSAWLPSLSLALLTMALLLGGGFWWMLRNEGPMRDVAVVLQEPEALPADARDDYWSGLLALRDGRLAEALVRLQRSSATAVDALTVRAAHARALVTAGRFREARAELEQATGIDQLPRDDRLRWDALVAEAAHDRRTAMNRYQAVFTYQPADVEAGFSLFDLQRAFADAAAAEATLASLQTTSADPSRLLLANAQLAALRGDVATRESLAVEAREKAEAGTTRQLQAALEVCEAQFARARLELASDCAKALRQQAKTLGHTRVSVRAVLIDGAAEREAGRYHVAAEHQQRASTEAQQQGDRIAWRDAELELAMTERMAGKLSAAQERLDRVEAALTFADDRPGRARLLGIRGITLAQAGDVDAARPALDAAIADAVALDLRPLEAGMRNNLALLDARSGRVAESVANFEKALQLFHALGDRRGEATALSNLAIHANRAGRPAQARDYNLTALEAFRAIDAKAEVARLQFNLGVGESRLGALADAASRIEEALAVFSELGATGYAAQAAATLSRIQLERGDARASAAAAESIDDDSVEDPLRRAALLAARGRLAFYRGELEAARSQLTEAHTLRERAGAGAWVLEVEIDLAQLDLAEGRTSRAITAATRLAIATREQQEPADAMRCELLLATASLLRDDRTAVREWLARAGASLEEVDVRTLRFEHELLSLLAQDADGDALGGLSARARQDGHGLIALRAARAAATDTVARARVEAGISEAGFDPDMFTIGWGAGQRARP